MENLTGHTITIVRDDGSVLVTLPPSSRETPIRAKYSKISGFSDEGIPVCITKYFTELSEERLDELAFKYKDIIVSKISSEALLEQGYKGNIYITGRKVYKDGLLVGVKELSKIN